MAKNNTKRANSRRTRAQRIAQALAAARRRMRSARRQLAAITKPGDGPALYDPAWKWAASLLEKRGHELLRSRNVIGHGVSWRRQDGMATDEQTVTVFVKRKLSPGELARLKDTQLPRRLKEGKRSIGIDVVQLGRLQRQGTGGDSIGPDGKLSRGTLGSFAIDDATGNVVAVTAMHVTGQQRDIPRPGLTRVAMRLPSLKDDAGAALFGAAVRGTLDRIDGCKIELEPSAALDDRIKGIGRIRGWRPILVPGDKGTAVRMFGAVSGLLSGVIEHPMVALPQFRLDSAILVDIPTRKGDSGAALVDRDGLVLGFLVGKSGSLRVFCPAGPVLDTLQCDIPTN